jgi:hypothetical protein
MAAGGGGGGGGCALRTDLRREGYDFSLVILMLIAGIYAGIARRQGIKSPPGTPPCRADDCGKTEKAERHVTETA